MNDSYVEFKEIPDGTPEEMAQFYANTINAGYTENRTAISKRYNELMPVQLQIQTDWKIEFKGKTFIFMQWGTVKYTPKEDYFDGSDAFGNKEV